MLVPLNWLRSFCDPGLTNAELAVRLRMTGTKDERLYRHGPAAPDHFTVGRVLAVASHPDAERLRVCTVDVGESDALTIVCGAPNVAGGQTVAVALPGAVLAGGQRLGAATLRGVPSEGMILAEDEIGLGIDHAGIIVLPDELAPGTALGEVVPLGDDVLELEITPNRPDCLSIYGVAREVHAATGAALAPPPWSEDRGDPGPAPAGVAVDVECPELCPRFTARVFEDVKVAPSPLWLKARLTAAGMRPVSNVVDVTNYVMLITGQPLHAFDLDRLAGERLTVRRAHERESIVTLDGLERVLGSDVVLIADAQGPTSIAGIMGGARSEVNASTTRIALEAATWVGANIQRSSLGLGLRSEASGRFEKGLPPESTLEAQALASALMIDVCGARVAPGTIDVGGPGPPPARIALRARRAAALLGTTVDEDRCAEILEALGFGVSRAGEALDVAVPHFRRNDITREIDLIEEVARIEGVDRLPATLPPRRGAAGLLSHRQRVTRRAEDALAALGFDEIVGWSFADPGLLDRLRVPATHSLRAVVELENPLSEDQSIMRPTLVGSLLDSARHNAARGAADVAVFESGTVYAAGDGPLADEHHALGALLAGAWGGSGWGETPRRKADFFAAKGVLGALLDALHVDWGVKRGAWPFLHPGRSAEVQIDGTRAGFVGELDPRVCAAWDLESAAVFAVDLGAVAAGAPEVIAFNEYASFPPVHEDLAVVLDDAVAAEQVLEVVGAHGGAELVGVKVFDVYRGEQVGEGRMSLGLHLEFRAGDRTLTAGEVGRLRAQIVEALAHELGGEVRG